MTESEKKLTDRAEKAEDALVSLCRHDLDISSAGIYCRTCGEEFEDNTGSNEMGG